VGVWTEGTIWVGLHIDLGLFSIDITKTVTLFHVEQTLFNFCARFSL
jgi:hypothetical protein